MAFSMAAWQEQFKSLPKIEIFPNILHEYVQKQLECSAPLHLTVQDHAVKPIPKLVLLNTVIFILLHSYSRIFKCHFTLCQGCPNT